MTQAAEVALSMGFACQLLGTHPGCDLLEFLAAHFYVSLPGIVGGNGFYCIWMKSEGIPNLEHLETLRKRCI